MKRFLIPAIIILFIAAIGFYLLSFMQAKEKSDHLMQEFKKAEQELRSRSDSLKNTLEKAQSTYPVAELKTQIILLIDSLQEQYKVEPESDATKLINKTGDDIHRLLSMMQQLNVLQSNETGALQADTISYWPKLESFTKQKWLTAFFKTEKNFQVVTYLNYLRNQTIAVK